MSDSAIFVIVDSVNNFDAILKSEKSSLIVLHFYASWAPQCQQVDDVLAELHRDSSLADAVKFLKVEAESLPELSSRYSIIAVPTCVLLKDGVDVDHVNGVNAAELVTKVRLHAGLPASSTNKPTADKCQNLTERLKSLVNSAPVMVFMKGTPAEARCGFSRTLVQILNDCNVKFSSFDILSDESVRQGLKEYCNWPTYPQLYIHGELVGGVDIVKELVASGEFQAMLPVPAVNDSHLTLDDRLKQLVTRDPVMLFMKGTPDSPRCGFSKTIVGLLNDKGVKYGHFDILEDEEVRQGLKKFSNWPTYPQLYIGGELIGGVDIVKELNASGELDSVLTSVAK